MAKSIKRNRNNRKKSRRVNKNRRSRITIKKIKGGTDNEITVVSYNILDVDLESNFVPRTMDGINQKKLKAIPLINSINELDNLSSIFDKLLLHTSKNTPNKDFVNGLIAKSNSFTLYDLAANLYSSGFHSGNKIKHANGSEPLNKVETRRLWGDKIGSGFASINGEQTTVNLRKMLTVDFINTLYLTPPTTLPVNDDLLNEIWNSILSVNDEQRKWTIRGPKIVTKIQSKTPDIICLQEYGNCKNKQMTDNSVIELVQGKIEENIPNKREYLDELENKQAHEEIRKDTLPYQLIYLGLDKEQVAKSPSYEYNFFGYNPDTTNGDDGIAIFYKKDKFTLKEHISINMDAANVTENEQTKNPYKSLRRAGVLVLEHNVTKLNFVICTAHLQSDSNERVNPNDNNKKNRVKTLELKLISEQILATYEKYNNPENNTSNKPPNVIFCGDFNLNMLKPKTEEMSKLHINAANTTTEILNEDKFTIQTNTLDLKRVKPDPDLEFTTYSSREEYIDFFYSNMDGSIDRIDAYQTRKEMPNTEEPSDHIMLTAKLQT